MPAAAALYTGASAVPQSTVASQPALQWVRMRTGSRLFFPCQRAWISPRP